MKNKHGPTQLKWITRGRKISDTKTYEKSIIEREGGFTQIPRMYLIFISLEL